MKQNISQKKIVTDTVNFKPSKLRSRLTGGSGSGGQSQGTQAQASPIGSLLEGFMKGFQGAQQTQRQQEEIELRREQIGLQKKEAEAKLRQQEIRNKLADSVEAPGQETTFMPGVDPQQFGPQGQPGFGINLPEGAQSKPPEFGLGFTGLSPDLALPPETMTKEVPAGLKERMMADMIRAGDTGKAFEMFQPKPVSVAPGTSLVDLAGGEPKEVYRSPEKPLAPIRGRAGDVFLDPTTGEQVHSIPEKNTEEQIRIRAAEQKFPDDLDKQASYIKQLKNSGSVGKPELAIRAVQGDATAKGALDLLNANERALTVVGLSQRAAAGDLNAQLAIKWLQQSRFSPMDQFMSDLLPRPGGGGSGSPPPLPTVPPAPRGQPLTPQPQPQAAPQGQQGFNNLPDPRQFKGQTMRDTQTGGRFKSDGTKWIPVQAGGPRG